MKFQDAGSPTVCRVGFRVEAFRVEALGTLRYSHRLLSSSFLWLVFRTL